VHRPPLHAQRRLGLDLPSLCSTALFAAPLDHHNQRSVASPILPQLLVQLSCEFARD
jgi:hypothetical protein